MMNGMASGDIIPGDSIARFKLDREKAQAEASAKKAKEAKKSSKKKRKAAKKSVPKKKKRAAKKGAKGKKKGGKKKGSKKGPGSDTTSMHNDEDISNSDISSEMSLLELPYSVKQQLKNLSQPPAQSGSSQSDAAQMKQEIAQQIIAPSPKLPPA
eukprot:855247_1